MGEAVAGTNMLHGARVFGARGRGRLSLVGFQTAPTSINLAPSKRGHPPTLVCPLPTGPSMPVRDLGLRRSFCRTAGIAWDAARGRLFVTGKNWPRLFEVRLVELETAGAERARTLQHYRRRCIVGGG